MFDYKSCSSCWKKRKGGEREASKIVLKMCSKFYGCCVVMKVMKTVITHSVPTIPTNKCSFITTQSSHGTVIFTRFHSLKSQVKKLGQLGQESVPILEQESEDALSPHSAHERYPRVGLNLSVKILGTALNSNRPAVRKGCRL